MTNEGVKYDEGKVRAFVSRELTVELYKLPKSPVVRMMLDAVPIYDPESKTMLSKRQAVILAVDEVMTFGATKYGRDNWQGLKDFEDRYFSASIRHLRHMSENPIATDSERLRL